MKPDIAAADHGQADFRLLAEKLSSLIALIRRDKLVYVNPAGCALLGRPLDWFLGRDFWEVVHPDDRQAAIARARARAAGIRQPRRLRERLLDSNGRTLWMDYTIDVVQIDGQPTTLCTGHDVTEHRRVEGELRCSEARLAEAQRIACVGSWEWDVASNRVVWSDELCRIFGTEPSRFGGTIDGYLQVVHQDDRALAWQVIQQALQHGSTFEFEHRVQLAGGDVRVIFGRGQVFRDAAGAPQRVAGTGQDITEQRRMQHRLQHSEERFRLAFTHAAIGKAIVDRDGRILQVNPAACRILGHSEAELLQLDTAAVTHPDDRARTAALLQRLLHGSEAAAALEQRMLHKDGRVVHCHLNLTAVREPGCAQVYCIAEFEDESERRRALEALRGSEERFRNLCTQAPVMLMSFDPDGRIRDVSNFWLQTTGYQRGEVVGQPGWRFITQDSQERLQRAIELNRQNDEVVIRNLPLQGICKDGRTIDLLSTSVAEVGDAGEHKGAICVQINLTDLQRAEAALSESAERYRALVEHAPEAIMVLDVEQNRFVDANAPAERLFGYSRQRLLTMGPLDFCPQHQAEGRRSCDVVAEEHHKVLAGDTAVFEFTHVDSNGREIVCQTTLTRLPAAGRRLIRATIVDVTEQKQLQEQVRHADRLAAVGVLAAGVAHEIGNPLMALSMAAQSLERRTPDDYTQTKLQLIREHIDRIARIVRQMGDLARPPSGARRRTDLDQLLRRAVDVVRYDHRARNAEIVYRLHGGLPAVEIAEDELTQVCINLALNAFDAMADNPAERPRRLTIASAVDAGRVRVTFSDTGGGVAPAARSRLFQPFFTTKAGGQGSGLGLSVSLRILQEHGGALRLDAGDGPGATFVFELPVAAAAGAAEPDA